jgi:asparagine synthase (glutamine-hydrolysing)
MLGQALDPRILLSDLLRERKLKSYVRELWAWTLLLRRPWIHLLRDSTLLQFPSWIRSRFSPSAKIDSWINPKFARKHRMAFRQLDAVEGPWYWAPSERDSLQTLLTLSRQLNQMEPTVEEMRYPYLDQDVCEFLMSIPTEQLLRAGERRSLMRRALGDLIPQEILHRRTKSSGSRYFNVGLEKHWDELQEVIIAPLASELGYINQQQFADALTDAKNGKLSLHFLRLMKALFWELWLRRAINAGKIIPDMHLEARVSQRCMKTGDACLPK